jgi:6-phosphogluconate dehydrogenase
MIDVDCVHHTPPDFAPKTGPYLMMIPFFTNLMNAKIESWRKAVAYCALAAIPVPLFGSPLNYFDAYTKKSLPGNIMHKLRDSFRAHPYERLDRSNSFHTIWK